MMLAGCARNDAPAASAVVKELNFIAQHRDESALLALLSAQTLATLRNGEQVQAGPADFAAFVIARLHRAAPLQLSREHLGEDGAIQLEVHGSQRFHGTFTLVQQDHRWRLHMVDTVHAWRELLVWADSVSKRVSTDLETRRAAPLTLGGIEMLDSIDRDTLLVACGIPGVGEFDDSPTAPDELPATEN